jgi:hypothetical protein
MNTPDELCTEEDWERYRVVRAKHLRAYTDERFERDTEEELAARARREEDYMRCCWV